MGRYQVLERACARYGSRVFAANQSDVWTYDRVHAVVIDVAQGLSSYGPARVGLLARNDVMYMVSTFAIARAGLTAVALNPANAIVAQTEVAQRADLEIILATRSDREQAEALKDQLPRVHTVLTIDADPGERSELEQWAEAQPRELGRWAPTGDHLESLTATGGTTGASKLAMNSGRSIDLMVANVLLSIDVMSYEPVNLVAPPMTHGAGGIALALTAAGARHVIHRGFNAEAVAAAVAAEGVTDLYVPPTAIYQLLDEPSTAEADLSSLRHVIYAGAPISGTRLREALTRLGPVLAQFYGQAEVPLSASCLTPTDHVAAASDRPNRLLSCGRVTPLTELAILDLDDDQSVAAGERGELAFRGDLVMTGYFGEPERDREAWHRTGDIGLVDEDGYLFLVDRKRDVIVTGGFNVFPLEVEQAIASHPAVADCAVVGLPHEKWGEQVTAFVELRHGVRVTADELIAVSKEHLGSIKAPKEIHFVAELPKSAVGKVLKRELREPFWQGNDRRV